MQRYSSGPYIFKNDELSITNSILMETPLFKNLFMQNQELEEQVQMLKHNIMYFESTNKKLMRKVDKLERKIGSQKKKTPIRQAFEELKEEILVKENNDVGVEETKEEEVVVVETEEEEDTIEVVVEETEEVVVVEETKEEEETDEVVVEETKEEEEEEEETKEEVVEETKEEVVVETEEEEEVTEEVVVETEEEEEEEEETEEVVVETEEEVEEEGAEEDVYEIEINGKTYYVSNERDSVIYAADENGDISIEAGVYKNGKPVFN